MLVAGALLILWRTVQFDPVGDEPHYLVLAHSIAYDGDLDVSDDYVRGVYRGFYHAELDAHLFAPGSHRSLHFPMLSFLIAPAYRAFGRCGATALVLLLNLVAVALTLPVLRAIGFEERASTWLVLAYFFASPWGTMASQIYPDSVALVCYAGLNYVLFARRPGRGTGCVAGLLVGVLCALHVKFSPAAVFYLAGMIAIMRSRSFTVSALLASSAVGAIHLALLHHLYSSWLPWAPMRENTMPQYGVGEYVQTAAMYLFDLQYGLIPQGPGWLLVSAGVLALLRHRHTGRSRLADGLREKRWELWLCLGTVVVHFATVSTWRWIGWSTSARYLAPVVVLAVPPACLGVKLLAGSRSGRVICGSLLGFQVLWFCVLNVDWSARYDVRALIGRWIGVDRNMVPYFIDVPRPSAPAHPQVWLVTSIYLALGLAVIAVSCRRLRPTSGRRQ